MTRCTGHCCKAFHLPYSPEQLAEVAHTIEDGAVIAEMAAPLGPGTFTDEGWWRYSCRNLTPSGDCAIYETRPRMCAAYPYGGRCIERGCTVKADDLTLEPKWTDDPDRQALEAWDALRSH